jgi:hypothetical protein
MSAAAAHETNRPYRDVLRNRRVAGVLTLLPLPIAALAVLRRRPTSAALPARHRSGG